jgi:hypothetical protein
MLAQGVMAGQQASRNAYEQAVKDKMLQEQIAEQQRARQEQIQARLEQRAAQEALPKVIRRPVTELYGEDIAGQRVGEGVKYGAPTLDINALLSLPIGVQQRIMPQVSATAELIPKLRKAGLVGEQPQQDNPFTIFAADKTLPPAILAIAKQYETSYQRGLIDPEKVDERIKQIGEAAQRAAQNASSEQIRREQMAQSLLIASQQQAIAREMLELRKIAEAAKPEQFSYSQKKDFDVVAEAKEEAKKASSNASIASRANLLLDDAYSGVLEAGVKNLAAAVGISSKAKNANDQLLRLSNQLAVNAPKFSGPTSDRDAARYDAAVGDLANPNKSIESKRKALTEIIELSTNAQKYATQQENYFYGNNKSLKGFKFNPYEGM